MSRSLVISALGALLFLSGCASSTFVERQQKRDQVAQAKGLYCGFVNGDEFPDLDVELNFAMANKCDPSKPFSVSPYRNSSAKNGVVYCCNAVASRAHESKAAASSVETKRPTVQPAAAETKRSANQPTAPRGSNTGSSVVPADTEENKD